MAKQTKLIIAWEGNRPIYATQEGLNWQKQLEVLRHEWERTMAIPGVRAEQSGHQEARDEYFRVMCSR